MIYITLIAGMQIAVLYSCIATSTVYDQEISDREQEAFLQLYNK